MRKKRKENEEMVVPDDERIIRGIPISKFIKRTRKGVKLNAKWSQHIVDCGEGEDESKIQVSVLDGMHFLAWKFQSYAKMMFYFPCGAMVMVIDGKLLIADKSSSQPSPNGEHKFGFPMTLLTPFEIKFIGKETWANFCSDDMEATFVIHQPDGFKIAVKRE